MNILLWPFLGRIHVEYSHTLFILLHCVPFIPLFVNGDWSKVEEYCHRLLAAQVATSFGSTGRQPGEITFLIIIISYVIIFMDTL